MLDTLNVGYLRARRITKKYAKSFYFASLFLPKEKKDAVYSLYAICRLSDEATDKDASLAELSTIKRNIDAVYANEESNINILRAFKETIYKYSIPQHYFDELIEGMYMDFRKKRYEDFGELKTYCYRVAGVVGLMMLKVFGYEGQDAEKYAVNLGIAMQLTNILRDIKEDYKKGRIYLPREDLSLFEVSENDIASSAANKKFKALLKFEVNRARKFYADSDPGIQMITDYRCRFATELTKEIYSGILDEIEKNDYDVFSKRVYVKLWGKLIRAFKTMKRVKK